MRIETQTVRIGENVGPVDWDHPIARDMPDIWREAEANPDDFIINEGFGGRAIYTLCMYDGWPYWTPTPAILHASPMGGSEWSFFNSYGLRPTSIVRRPNPTPAIPAVSVNASPASPSAMEARIGTTQRAIGDSAERIQQ